KLGNVCDLGVWKRRFGRVRRKAPRWTIMFGVDTFRNHLDLIPWDPFKQINGGTTVNNQVIRGEPDFAGRNFLGGDFIWGHGEATGAIPPPRPEALSPLNRLTSFIPPMQAPNAARQQTIGPFGFAKTQSH